ncbi:MAG: hypothetical protein ABJD24_02560 [Acidimicrobiales bacterium]|jgi:hypothetical protein
MSVQVRLALSKREERVDGPDDADVIVTIGVADAAVEPTVAYMQGKLKATGHTGRLIEALQSGEIAAAVARLNAAT